MEKPSEIFDRLYEWSELTRFVTYPGAEPTLGVVSGRRRQGKTFLLDAICQVTGVPEKFDGHPAGSRAIQMWDSQVPHYFLRLFGRPQRTTPCECERNTEPAIAQVLHVLNSPEIEEKLGHAGGRIARLRQAHRDDDRALVHLVGLSAGL